MLRQPSVKSDWLFNTQSRVLQTEWSLLESNEKATLNINMPYCTRKNSPICQEGQTKGFLWVFRHVHTLPQIWTTGNSVPS